MHRKAFLTNFLFYTLFVVFPLNFSISSRRDDNFFCHHFFLYIINSVTSLSGLFDAFSLTDVDKKIAQTIANVVGD